MSNLDDLGDEYLAVLAALFKHAEALGIPEFFWDYFFSLEVTWNIGLLASYYERENELINVRSGVDADPEVEIQSGAYFISKRIDPTSLEWFICHATERLLVSFLGSGECRDRASFQFGLAVAEAQWIAYTKDRFDAGRDLAVTRSRAGRGGANASKNKRLANLALLIQKIEDLSGTFGIFSENRIVEQAFEAARQREPKFPKSKKTLDDYGTALRSEEPFKSRYEAVFRKNT